MTRADWLEDAPPDDAIDPLLHVSPSGENKSFVVKAVRRRRFHRRLLVGATIFLVLVAPISYSYGRALTGPGNDSNSARTVEWLREHKMGGLVDRVERAWFARHQAPVGGTPNLHVLTRPVVPSAPSSPQRPATAATVPRRVAPAPSTTTPANPLSQRLPAPRPFSSPAPSPFLGEGHWLPFGPSIHGAPGAYVAITRPDAIHLSSIVAVAWFDPHVVSIRQFPGLKVPGAPWDRPPEVPIADRSRLVATFSGGFRLPDSHGGMILAGRVLRPMRAGAATLAVSTTGIPSIGTWGQEIPAAAGYDSVRQNLDLIVDHGTPNPALTTDPNRRWGFTGPANREFVWRSGAGILPDGALVWIGGPGLSISSLAALFVHVGAVRAMQLDINHEWVQFNTYRTANGTVQGSRILKDMRGPDDRWLSQDTRDFFAVFART